LGVGEGHLLHRETRWVGSRYFAKSESLFQSFPNDRGGNTYSIYGPSDPRAGSHKIQGFQTGKDLIDFSDTLKHMGLNSFTLQTLGPDAIKKPGDTLLNWVPEDNTTYIHVHNRPPLSITAEGEVRNGDIVGSGWT
ncbi:hypothetical protein, partial [Pseudomonas sp. ICMP 8385]|uniref:hypothetical protein n=1 Tax=Pseudomonas sp. ICMP 8385 TaxID=1718920 RepID=UPI00159BC82D